MALSALKPEDRGAAETARFIERLIRDISPRNFAIELWDGTRLGPGANQFHRFTWKINNPDVLRSVFNSPNRQLALGEAYVRGEFDIEGDIEAVFPLSDHLIRKKWSLAEKVSFAGFLAESVLLAGHHPNRFHQILGHAHSKRRDRQAIRYHYDVSNDFYELWLDQNMLYSCAYFHDFTDDLETAQFERMELICSKLCLRPGERLLDIGCGWGGLMMHAARNYGVEAVGITISDAQASLAESRIRRAGLSQRCRAYRLDYRDLDEAGGFDKVASIGMVEHVGEVNLPTYFQKAFRLLRPGGLFLVSGIGKIGRQTADSQPTFTDIYVFPGGELPPIATTLSSAEESGFEVRGVENLREHYDFTTRHWLRRLEAKAQRARELVGEERYRIWRLYLAGSAYYFQKGWLGLYQTLLLKGSEGERSPVGA